MILLGSTLLNAPVMSIQTGGELARTSSAIIDPSNLSVIAYKVMGPLVHHSNQLIRVADVRELSSIGLIIDSSDEFVIPDDIIKLQSIYELHFDILGMPVIDQKKKKLGKVIDYTVETGGYVVQQLTVKRPLLRSLNDTELLIHRSQIVEINNHEIVVHSEVSVPEPKRHEVSGSYVNPFRGSAKPAPESVNQSNR